MSDVAFFPPNRVVRKRARKGKSSAYAYPYKLLDQDYFCRGGNGNRCEPSVSPMMVTSPEFASPLENLLKQLDAEGHDVAACRLEYLAMKRALLIFGRWADEMHLFHIVGKRPSDPK